MLRYYPWCCYSNCQRDHCAEETVNSELACCRWCMHVCVYLVPFIFQWVHSLLLLEHWFHPHPTPSSTATSWTPASSIWSRLWPCSVPGSGTLTAKALLSTDELSEHTPSPLCVISACLHLPASTHTRSLRSTLSLYLRYKSEAAEKTGNKEFRKNVKLMLIKREPR